MKKGCQFLLVAATALTTLFCTPIVAHAETDYYIEDLDVHIDVQENNVFNITETYTYNFLEPHHGPSRVFPLDHYRFSEDGTYRIIADVKKLKVKSDDAPDDIADKDSSEETLTIYVGDEDVEVSGEHTYTMSYKYKIYTKDPLEDKDELYFNIVGTGYQCPIEHVTWTITMPKDFDSSTIGYSVGAAGDAGYELDYLYSDVEDNVIYGEYDYPLQAYEGITIRAILPEGYFKYRSYSVLGWIIGIISLLGSIVYIVPKIHRKQKPVEVVNFYPPNDLSPVAMEAVYTGMRPQRVTAMIPYLANKGYFDIRKDGDDYSFILKRRANPSEVDKATSVFMEGIAAKHTIGEEIKTKKLKKKFHETIEAIQDYYAIEADNQFDQKASMQSAGGSALAALSGFVALIAFYCLVLNTPLFRVEPYLYGAIIVVIGWLVGTAAGAKGILKWIALIVMILMVPLTLSFAITEDYSDVSGAETVILVCILVYINWMVYLSTFIAHRTEESIKLLGEILGFKNFIKTAELDRLKMLSKENPSYFYDILGYAYMFELEDEWMKNFDELKDFIQPPSWYSDPDSLAANYLFYRSLDNMMSHTSKDLTYVPPSSRSSSGGSGGGGFSGGGFSGGGSGGGGGGAW